MTSTTDAAGHPDVTELSDLTEGLLSSSRTTDVRRHLDDCPVCADVYASLEEIQGLLGTLPGPSTMPADVAGRIDAALAAEALLSATAPGLDAAEAETSVSTSRPPVDDDCDGDGAHVSRETLRAGAGARPEGRARAATGPGRTARSRRGRRGIVALSAVCAAAALGLGVFLSQSLSDGEPGGSPATAAQKHTDAAHTFTEGRLENQVADLLSTSKGSGTQKPWGIESGTTGSKSDEPQTLQETAVQVPACIEQGIDRDDPALAVSQGVYQGMSAYLVVLPHASDTTRVTAYVVDATCVSQDSAAPGKVLLTHSYTR
ncbi:anti-sigma factor family protein [Streptomyces sp. NPDC059785]|uniref:anti-sigma factor family protein n=1 Tax=Streptomyces sp. NPDC059785 TaxID=3346945 RepID=UPI0036548290